jgi:hypothetical protein
MTPNPPPMRPVPRRIKLEGSGIVEGGGGGGGGLKLLGEVSEKVPVSVPPDCVRAKVTSAEVSVKPAAANEPAGVKNPLITKKAPDPSGPVGDAKKSVTFVVATKTPNVPRSKVNGSEPLDADPPRFPVPKKIVVFPDTGVPEGTVL